ncbi:MAG: hypothetical protein J6R01_01750 [Alistipes sp.]|nr:hypothetical protein [Alistipes sp.]
MRKLFSIFTLMAYVIGLVGCEPITKPEITLTEVEVLADKFTFEVRTNVAGELGYAVVAEGYKTPSINELFTHNTAIIKRNATITIEKLNDNTKYTLFAVLRATDDGTLSDPKKLTFTTPDDGVDSPITIDNVGYDNVTFTINLPGNMLFQCIDKASLEYYGQTPEDYISTPGIGILDNGPLTVEWYDGGSYGMYEMRMREDSEYYVIAVSCDSSKNITGKIYMEEFKTLRKPTSEAGITTNLMNIGSTSVEIMTQPDDTVVEYYVYVRDKAWSDGIVAGYGESMLMTLVKSPSAGSWHLSDDHCDTWGGLTPETDYYCHIVVIDNKGAEALTRIEFTTTAKQLAAPTLEMSVTEDANSPHNTLYLNLRSDSAASAKVVFRATADVHAKRVEGYDDQYIVNNFGTDIGQVDLDAINNTGLSIKMENLWPEVEYTVMVSVKNAEHTETFEATTYTTPKQAAATRVESELFTSLLGEWQMTYTLVQENGITATVSDVVTIAQGVDAKTEADYRNQNRLVILGLPFNVSAQGVYSALPVYSPAYLLESLPNYYSKGQNLIYRDYGPKFFLEIGQGDVLTVPTSKGEYLYNWAEEGYLNFYGCDYDNQFTAPATFPVTISDGGDTLTIGAYHSGEEFGFGIYRPAVFLNDYQLKACATSDIVLTRVK